MYVIESVFVLEVGYASYESLFESASVKALQFTVTIAHRDDH